MILSADDERPEANDKGSTKIIINESEPKKVRRSLADVFFGIPFEIRMGVGGFTAILVVGLLVWSLFFRTHSETMTAERFEWQRRIEVLDYQPRSKNGWSTPSDAYNITRERRIHHYERVFSHYRSESYSCGTSQQPRTCTRQVAVYRDEPVYRWYYFYLVDRWEFSRWIITGAKAKVPEPHWADLSDEVFDSSPVYGNEQLSGTRNENYKVFLVNDEGKTYERVVSQADWEEVSQDELITVHITATGIIRSVDWDPK